MGDQKTGCRSSPWKAGLSEMAGGDQEWRGKGVHVVAAAGGCRSAQSRLGWTVTCRLACTYRRKPLWNKESGGVQGACRLFSGAKDECVHAGGFKAPACTVWRGAT